MGLAVHAEPAFAHRIEENMKPIIHLFTPIFFVMVGLSLNLNDDVYAALVIALSTVLPIFVIKWFYSRFDKNLDTDEHG